VSLIVLSLFVRTSWALLYKYFATAFDYTLIVKNMELALRGIFIDRNQLQVIAIYVVHHKMRNKSSD